MFSWVDLENISAITEIIVSSLWLLQLILWKFGIQVQTTNLFVGFCVLFEWFLFVWLVGWAFLFFFCFDEEVEHKNYFCSKALVYK